MTDFRTAQAFSSFSVDDLGKALVFYGTTLGLDVKEIPEGLDLQLGGGQKVFIYPSEDYHAPDHTVLNFLVDDIDSAVDDLIGRNIRMEQYDQPGIKTDSKGVFRNHSGHGPAAVAWFKDPAGHILSVVKS